METSVKEIGTSWLMPLLKNFQNKNLFNSTIKKVSEAASAKKLKKEEKLKNSKWRCNQTIQCQCLDFCAESLNYQKIQRKKMK